MICHVSCAHCVRTQALLYMIVYILIQYNSMEVEILFLTMKHYILRIHMSYCALRLSFCMLKQILLFSSFYLLQFDFFITSIALPLHPLLSHLSQCLFSTIDKKDCSMIAQAETVRESKLCHTVIKNSSPTICPRRR